jgi:hypothetical protein
MRDGCGEIKIQGEIRLKKKKSSRGEDVRRKGGEKSF